jgi:hypothetical protein
MGVERITWAEAIKGLRDVMSGALAEGVPITQHLKNQSDRDSRAMNARLPEGLRRTEAQMDHILACPHGPPHICGAACGYPGAVVRGS